MENIDNEKPDCCKKDVKKESQGFSSGIVYGLIPHIGCIAFIVFTVLGVTAATAFFKPILLNPYFFYILIVLSLVFATISAMIYLKKNRILTILGIKRKWKYLSILYGTTIFINLLLFMIIFPYATNLISKPSVIGAFISIQDSQAILSLRVAIPCPGHAPLITEELNNINGVTSVQFRFPNLFDVSYDQTKTSKQQIISLDVFDTYKATVIDESVQNITDKQTSNIKSSCGCGSSCGGDGCCG